MRAAGPGCAGIRTSVWVFVSVMSQLSCLVRCLGTAAATSRAAQDHDGSRAESRRGGGGGGAGGAGPRRGARGGRVGASRVRGRRGAGGSATGEAGRSTRRAASVGR